MQKTIFLILAIILSISLTTVFANIEDNDIVDTLFSPDVTNNSVDNDSENNNVSQETEISEKNVTDSNTTISNNSNTTSSSETNTTNNTKETEIEPEDPKITKYKAFKKEWYEKVRKTKYQRYSNHQKSFSQMENDKAYNCYDGAYYSICLATKHGLDSKIVHGKWNGVGHGAVRVLNPEGEWELFDTTQYQKGMGQNSQENNIKWDFNDTKNTLKAKKEANEHLNNNQNTVETQEPDIILFDENSNDLSCDLSSDLSCDLSSDLSIDFTNILNIFN